MQTPVLKSATENTSTQSQWEKIQGVHNITELQKSLYLEEIINLLAVFQLTNCILDLTVSYLDQLSHKCMTADDSVLVKVYFLASMALISSFK